MAAIGRKGRLPQAKSSNRVQVTRTSAKSSRSEALARLNDTGACGMPPYETGADTIKPDILVCSTSVARASGKGICIRNVQPQQIANAMAVFEVQARFFHAMGSPRADHLLTLIQFNVLRALFSNTRSLGFGLEWLLPDSESPFSANITSEDSGIMPLNLRPSSLQRRVSHHPWIDLLPDSTMRDNILRAGNTFDEDDLCNDLVDFDGIANEQTGLIAWTTPWMTSGWEVSVTFAHKWPWILQGCEDLIASTNYWRAQRGDEELMI